MASGPKHYREAQRLAQLALTQYELDKFSELPLLTMAQAQVHATLALAAATAPVSSGDWQEVILRDKAGSS